MGAGDFTMEELQEALDQAPFLKRRRCPNTGNWEYLDSRVKWPKGCDEHPATAGAVKWWKK